jgi:hypothetical protein
MSENAEKYNAPSTNTEALRPYFEVRAALIPLHLWSDTRPDKNKPGQMVKLGKSPMHYIWGIRDFCDPRVIGAKAPKPNPAMNRLGPDCDVLRYAGAGHNIGCRMGEGWGVLDYDPREDKSGESLRRLMADFGLEADKLAIVATGREPDETDTGSRRGVHVYLRIPVGWRGAEKSAAYPGVAFLHGSGRQVTAAGSLHPNTGKPYVWRAGGVALKDTMAAPEALLAAFARKAKAERKQTGPVKSSLAADMLGLIDPCKLDRSQWLSVSLAFRDSWEGDEGEALAAWHDWSARDPRHEWEADEQGVWGWYGEGPEKSGFGTIVHIAKEHAGDAAVAAVYAKHRSAADAFKDVRWEDVIGEAGNDNRGEDDDLDICGPPPGPFDRAISGAVFKAEKPIPDVIAGEFLRLNFSAGDQRTLVFYRGEWWVFVGYWRALSGEGVKALARKFLAKSECSGDGGIFARIDRVNELVAALKGSCFVDDQLEAPFNLRTRKPIDEMDEVAFANGVYQVSTGAFRAHTAEEFRLNTLPYPLDFSGAEPVEFMRYLEACVAEEDRPCALV